MSINPRRASSFASPISPASRTSPTIIPEAASPRGIAIRFYLGEHVHTDIVAHSADGFPVRTGEEFLELNRAVAASPPDATHPTPIEKFLGAHPLALRFVQLPKPIPTSFARESFFAVSAMRFTTSDGKSQFGRYRILPTAGNEFLSADEAAKKSPNFLMDEMTDRLKRGPVSYRILVQLAAPGDEVNDATVHWPDSREQVEFGTVTLTERVNELDPEMRKIIFDPRPRSRRHRSHGRPAVRSPRRALSVERPPSPSGFKIAFCH